MDKLLLIGPMQSIDLYALFSMTMATKKRKCIILVQKHGQEIS